MAKQRNNKKSGHDYTDAKRGIRLQKAMAQAGVASRRTCEEIIEAGRVRVNGDPVTTLPAWVDPAEDRIDVDGEPLVRQKPARETLVKTKRAKPQAAGESSDESNVKSGRQNIGNMGGMDGAEGVERKCTYVLLNKPRHVITTTSDPEGRKNVMDLVDLPQRLFPVGRLDADSIGLILLTDDGDLAHRLTHPSYGVTKTYHVTVRGRLVDADYDKLTKGLHLTQTDGTTRRATMNTITRLGYERDQGRGGESTGGTRTRLAITLREGQNREIRRMLARLGYKVRRLRRIAIGPLGIKGLSMGQWRFLTMKEIKMLRRAAEKD